MIYSDYDWLKLILSGTLYKLKVKELDKYLDEQIRKKNKKRKKIEIITTHRNTRY